MKNNFTHATFSIFLLAMMPDAYALFHSIPTTSSFGSAQMTKRELHEFIQDYKIRPESFTIIDLRGEPHLFINGTDRYLEPQLFDSPKSLCTYEEDLAKAINRGEPVMVRERQPKPWNKQQKNKLSYKPIKIPAHAHATTEQDIAHELGIGYIRIPNDDYACPSRNSVQLFIQQVTPLLQNSHTRLLLHCHGGHGRTTLYAMVLDMLLHAKNTSLHDIITRQSTAFNPSFLKNKKKTRDKNKLLQEMYTYIREHQDTLEEPKPTRAFA